MACISAPKAPVPQLPSPLTLAPPTVSYPPGFNAALCCNIKFPAPDPPYPLNQIPPMAPGVLNLATINTLLQLLDKVNQFTDQLAIDCPLESSST